MLEDKNVKIMLSMHKAIQKKNTGTHRSFANHLGISIGELNKLLSYLRNKLDFKIRYDKIKQTFYYVEDPLKQNNFDKSKSESKSR